MQPITETDLSICDDEPIHLLGKIQSIGYLIAFNKISLKLTYYSSNITNLLPNQDLSESTTLESLFDLDFVWYIKKLTQKGFKNELYPLSVDFDGQKYKCYLSDANDEIIIECDKIHDSGSDFKLFNQFNTVIDNLRNVNELNTLYATIVHDMKSLFGFDRVMMYKFDADGNGEVIAEEKAIGLDSFLGLKYPATDIPKQARKLYLTNLSRGINNIDDNPFSIICLKQRKNELDLSYSVFRSVSPIHIQYLKNMGVTATHAISLIIKKRLWGMLIFHNYSGAKYLDFNSRQIAQTLAVSTCMSIELLETKQQRENSERQMEIIRGLKFVNNTDKTTQVLIENWQKISKTLKVCGFAVFESATIIDKYGITPDENSCSVLYNVIKENSEELIVFSNELNKYISGGDHSGVDGFLSMTVSRSAQYAIIFFRLGHEKIVNWAGNPEKTMEIQQLGDKQILTPRSSFALWRENVKNQSLEWTFSDISFAHLLCDAFVTREIDKFSELLMKNESLKDHQENLTALLGQKSEELYRLTQKLQQELKENKKYQKEIEIAKAASEHLNKIKSDILSNIGHEIRTPINGIIGLAQLITTDYENKEEVVELSTLILVSAERLLETVNRLLDVARIENKEANLVFESVELIDFLQTLIKPMKVLCDGKSQKLVFNAHLKEFPMITDKHYIEQIFINLLSNAIKYTPKFGSIEINVKKVVKDGIGNFYLAIQDTGIGIDESIIHKIFDPFFTEAEVPRQSDNSTGLGLHLVKNYLSYLDGSIEVNSKKGTGSEFIVNIPIKN